MNHKTRKEQEFEKVFEAYQNDVYKVCLYFTERPDIAEELAQRTFYQFYLRFDYIRLETARAYLLRSARNLTYNWIGEDKRQREMENYEIFDYEEAQYDSAEEIIFRKQQKKDAKALSDSILERLYNENRNWYEVITMIYLFEKPHEKVAEELGITPEVLYSRLYRAKKWICKNYQEQYEEVKRLS